MFVWNEESIRFHNDAALYTGCYDLLAEHVAEHLTPGCRIFDGGCGLGHLSLALARRGYDVTGMDISASAIASFRQTAANAGLPVNIAEGDLFGMPEDASFDNAVFCFFGGTTETLKWAKIHCTGRLILIKKNWYTHRFTRDPEAIRRFTFPVTVRELDSLGIPYETEIVDVDMGQPFRSLEDAVRFFGLYDPEGEPEATDILPRLTETGDPVFPYFLSSLRPVGMIIIRAADIDL